MLANVARNNTVASRKPTTFASIQAKSSQNFSYSSFSSSFAFTSKNKINFHNKLNTSKNQIPGQNIHTPSNSSGSLQTLNTTTTTKTNSTAKSAAAIHSSSSQKQSAAAAAAAKPTEDSANFNFSLGKNDPYPSRIFNDPQVIDRRDPVVWPRNESLNLPSEPLSQQELQEYRDNGFLVMRNVLSQDVVSRCRNDIQSMINKFENRGDSRVTSDVKYVTEPGSGTLRSIFETHKDTQHHIGHVVRRPEILNRARQILQDEIYVHQSRINFHRAFKGTGFSWHSDFETWHVEDGIPGMRALSCVVFLTNNDSSNGALMVIPGSHNKFISCVGETPENNWETSLKHQQEIGVPDSNNLRRMAALARENGTEDINIVHATGRPGDVLFFDCNLLHGSHSNISPFDRTNAFFVLNSMSNKIQDIPNPRPEHIACRDPKYVKPLTPIEDDE